MTLSAISEAAARTKWCPHVRETFQGAGTYNRANRFEEVQGVRRDTGQLSTTFTCKGSMCMMWRWADMAWRWAARDEGYCGLAGKPSHNEGT